MEILIEARPQYLFTKFAGPFTYSFASAGFKQVAEATEKHKCSRVLIDVTGLTGEIGIMDLHDLGVELAALQKYFTRIAMLVRPDQLLPDRFMQNVVRNRGLDGTGFVDLSEAEAWLTNTSD